MRTDAVKGYLDLLLLSELGRGPGHGYALIERLRERSGGTFDFPEGTIYPALHRLEHGRAVLDDHLREWRLFARSVERVLAA